MTLSLPQQRDELRRRLVVQRALIAQRTASAVREPGGYPRSLTMRLLTRHPDLAARLLLALARKLRPGKAFRRAGSPKRGTESSGGVLGR